MAHLTFDDGFYHADRARDIAIGNGAGGGNVLTEINALQVAVDENTKNGLLVLDSDDAALTTVMTTEEIYYTVWSDYQDALRHAADAQEESEIMSAKVEMDRVIAYFSRRGYSISRDRSGTANRIKWIIKW